MKKHLAVIMCTLLSFGTYAQTYFTDFEEADGGNTYVGLDKENWADPAASGFSANAGSEVLMSANGNTNIDFNDLAITKTLGGIIEDKTYNVSFYITTYGTGGGVAFENFSELYIGGATGEMIWDVTPTPAQNQWVQWTGTYTPNQSDIGQPFVFKAVFDLLRQKSIALDGPIGIGTNVTTSTTKSSINDAVNAYPNPFNENLTIDLNENSGYDKIEIFNTAGERVQVIDQPLNIATWNGLCSNGSVASNGMYTLRIQNENATIVKRVILNRTN